MTVLGCKTCGRYISVSFMPEGNPVALEEPEKWALIFAECSGCGAFICDRCIGNSRECPACGAAVTMHEPGDGFAYLLQERIEGNIIPRLQNRGDSNQQEPDMSKGSEEKRQSFLRRIFGGS